MKAAWWTTVVCEATQTCGTTLSVWETLEMDSNHSSGRQLNICSQLNICRLLNICSQSNIFSQLKWTPTQYLQQT